MLKRSRVAYFGWVFGLFESSGHARIPRAHMDGTLSGPINPPRTMGKRFETNPNDHQHHLITILGLLRHLYRHCSPGDDLGYGG
jgi:hypothetical protein